MWCGSGSTLETRKRLDPFSMSLGNPRTYQRTLNQVDRAELLADEHFYRRLDALTARVKRRRP